MINYLKTSGFLQTARPKIMLQHYAKSQPKTPLAYFHSLLALFANIKVKYPFLL